MKKVNNNGKKIKILKKREKMPIKDMKILRHLKKHNKNKTFSLI